MMGMVARLMVARGRPDVFSPSHHVSRLESVVGEREYSSLLWNGSPPVQRIRILGMAPLLVKEAE